MSQEISISRRRLRRGFIDYVIASRPELEIVACIELVPQRGRKPTRDPVLARILAGAEIPWIRIQERRVYNVLKIRPMLKKAIEKAKIEPLENGHSPSTRRFE